MKRQKPDLMERARAARALIEATRDDGTALAAFMALFHPEKSDQDVRELVRDARDRQNKRLHGR